MYKISIQNKIILQKSNILIYINLSIQKKKKMIDFTNTCLWNYLVMLHTLRKHVSLIQDTNSSR